MYQVVLEQDIIFILIKNVLKIVALNKQIVQKVILLLKNMLKKNVNVIKFGIMMKSLEKKNVMMEKVKKIVIVLVILI